MSNTKGIKDAALDLLVHRFRNNLNKKYEAEIKKSIETLPPVELSKTQIDEIQDYWQTHFGQKITTLWHEFFLARTGNFSPKYIPTSVWRSSIVYTLNYHRFADTYADKGFYDTLFSNVCRPKTFVKCVNGYFYTDKESISREEALRLCSNLDSAIIKPTLGGTWGNGVSLIKTKDGKVVNKEKINSVEQLFSQYGRSFIIQEKIEQHPAMAALNPDSVNTLRVMTYRNEKEVVVLYSVIRIGRKGKSVDNETAGGIKADVDITTGRIKGCATGTPKEGLIYKTDCGTELENYQIPCYNALLNKAKELHLQLPYLNIIGWDFTIGSNNEPVMIEFNICPDLSQVAHGPAFGEYTEEILHLAKERPNTRGFMLGGKSDLFYGF